MTQARMYYGGLVFSDSQPCALDLLCRIVIATLEDCAHPVDRHSILNRQQARIQSCHYMVKLALADPVGPGLHAMADNTPSQRFEITLYPLSSEIDDTDAARMMLAVMLYRMVDIYPASTVEWLHPDTVLEVEHFLSAFGGISAHRRHAVQGIANAEIVLFPPVNEPQDAKWGDCGTLSQQTTTDAKYDLILHAADDTAISATDPNTWSGGAHAPSSQDLAENDIRRLATWGMTGMVAFLSAPVALSMAAVNLARGEDFRLNTHVLALTGLLVMLQSSGALASVVSHLPM